MTPVTTPSTNGKPKIASVFAGRKVKGYRRFHDDVWFYHPALREGRFTRRDVPAMMHDDAVLIGLSTIFGPLSGAQFEVRANGKDIKTFVENTLYRFWHHDLMKVCEHYVPYGTSVCEVLYEFDNDSGHWKYAGLDDFHMDDVQVMRSIHGRHLTGIRVTNGGAGYAEAPNGPVYNQMSNPDERPNEVRHPKIFWCAHRPTCGKLWGRSAMVAAWNPWMEKCGSHGAISIRKLWAFQNAFRGCWVSYPVGSTMYNGNVVDNQDIAREIAENACTGAVGAIPSQVDEHGNELWRINDPKLNGDIKGLMDYPESLDKAIWRGMGVHDEVISAPDTGGSWSGRSGPLLVFLNYEDIRVRELVTSFDVGPSGYTTRNSQSGGVIRPLVMKNFGAKAKYEIRPVSLVPKPAEPGAGGTPGSAPGGMGQPPGPSGMGGTPPPAAGPQPVKLSAVELPDDAVHAILAGDVSLSASLFDALEHPREDATGRFTHKPISGEHVKAAQKAFKSGKLKVSKSESAITSDASGHAIHHHVTLQSGQRVHPDELHRLKVVDGESVLHHDEGLANAQPAADDAQAVFGGKGVALSTDASGHEHKGKGEGGGQFTAHHALKAMHTAKDVHNWTFDGIDAEIEKIMSLSGADLKKAVVDIFGEDRGTDLVKIGKTKTGVVEAVRRQFRETLAMHQRLKTETGLSAQSDEGRWITIGGTKDEDGKRKGGSPVFIEDGKITKGHPSLTGRKIDNIKEPPEPTEHHRKLVEAKQPPEETSIKQRANVGVGKEPAKAKEPWQMTKEEHHKAQPEKKTYKNHAGEDVPLNELEYKAANNRTHRQHVSEALAAGKDVPLEIVQDHPGIFDDAQQGVKHAQSMIDSKKQVRHYRERLRINTEVAKRKDEYESKQGNAVKAHEAKIAAAPHEEKVKDRRRKIVDNASKHGYGHGAFSGKGGVDDQLNQFIEQDAAATTKDKIGLEAFYDIYAASAQLGTFNTVLQAHETEAKVVALSKTDMLAAKKAFQEWADEENANDDDESFKEFLEERKDWVSESKPKRRADSEQQLLYAADDEPQEQDAEIGFDDFHEGKHQPPSHFNDVRRQAWQAGHDDAKGGHSGHGSGPIAKKIIAKKNLADADEPIPFSAAKYSGSAKDRRKARRAAERKAKET